ncbi:ATP-binding protein [Chloroflexi bacterium TSY]|nr:ATP-binding protein [Chloroflexi bacterium TSY]
MKPFIGRDRELKILDNLIDRQGAQFLVLYGRRRIGKTALLNQWQISREKNSKRDRTLYWMATQTSFTNQLRDFSQTIFGFRYPESVIPEEFSYHSWEEAFSEAGRIAESERVVVILDEFTYVMQASSEIASILQKVWDHQLQNSQILLILSGSLAGMIERHILGYRAALYGRATARLKLQPLPFGALALLLPKMTTEQRVAVYTITGGIPAYIQPFDDNLNLIQNLRERIITPINVMLNDAVFLLREQVEEPRNYMAVIESIANGRHRLSDIAKGAGLDRSNVNRYLTVLRELGYAERCVPVTVRHPERSRRGRHVIVDPYMRFYFTLFTSLYPRH